MSIRPIHKDVVDTLPIALTLIVINIALVIKSNKYKLYSMRLIEPLIQISAIGTLMYAFENSFKVNSFNLPMIAIVSMIPTTIHLIGVILTEDKRKSIHLIFNILFLLTLGVILSLSNPLANLVISGYALLVVILITSLTKIHHFGIVITAISIGAITALLNLTEQDGITLLIVISVLLAVLGNLWRIPLIFGHSDAFLHDTLRYIKRAAILSAIPILLFSFLTIHFTNHLILLQYLALSIMFLTAPIKGSKFKLIAGVGPTLAFWHLLNISDTPKYANAQLYAFPVVIMTLAAVCRAKQDIFDTKRPLRRSKDRIDRIFAFLGTLLAITLPLNIALVQSIYDPSPFNLIQGVTLLTICIVLLVFGIIKKYMLLKYISIVYIIAEVIVLLWKYSNVIPWWIYPAIIGSGFLIFSLRTMIGITDEMKEELTKK